MVLVVIRVHHHTSGNAQVMLYRYAPPKPTNPTRLMRVVRSAFALVMFAVLLTACAISPKSAAERIGDGISADFQTGTEYGAGSALAHPIAGWINDEEFGIVLLGSSSCPPVITRVKVLGPDALQFSIDTARRGNCTDDAAPRTHIFSVPAQITERPVKLFFNSLSTDEYLLLP